MTTALRAAYGKTVKSNCDASGLMNLLNKVAKAGLLEKPLRVRVKDAGPDAHGYCDSDFDEDGTACGHDIVISCMNDGLLAHELAHALTAETLTYDDLKVLNPHGSVFQRALTIIIETFEEE